MATNGLSAVKSRTTFRLECSVSADIAAPPERVWGLLTRVDDMTRWNSTLTSIEGNIEQGGTVSMKVPEAPTRTFNVLVTRFVPNKEMEWSDGNFIFRGVRTYTLDGDGAKTRFSMTEVFTGWMLPLIAGQLPDFGPIFERYASDLKTEAEKQGNSQGAS